LYPRRYRADSRREFGHLGVALAGATVRGRRATERIYPGVLAIAPDGRHFAASSGDLGRLIDRAGGHRDIPPQGAWIHSVGVTPDGRGLAVTFHSWTRVPDWDGPARLWDIAEHRWSASLEGYHSLRGRFCELAILGWRPDGRWGRPATAPSSSGGQPGDGRRP